MKVKITFEVNDDERRAVAFHLNERGKANYDQVRDFLEREAAASLDAVLFDYSVAQEEKRR